MKLRQFEFLCMLDEYGTISRVAEESFTSQPAVSIAIKELESELGYPILYRSNRGTMFTERGKLILEQAKNIMLAIEQINHISAYQNGELTGTLRIGALPHLCNTLLLDVQTELQEQHPEFTLQIHGMETAALIKLLERGSVDFILIQDCDFDIQNLVRKTAQPGLVFNPLFEDKLSFVVAEGHPLLRREGLTLEDVRQYPFVVFGSELNCHVAALTAQTGYPAGIRRFEEMIRMRRHMERYHSVTVLPNRAVIHGNMNYHIKFLPLTVDGFSWKTTAGWLHRGNEFTHTEQAVADCLGKHVAKQKHLSMDI